MRELTRIEAAGAKLPARALRWLRERRSQFDDFVASSVSVGFPTGVFGGWVPPKPDTDLDGLSGEALATAIDERLRSDTSSWSGPARGVWDWLDDGRNALRLAQALLSADQPSSRFGKAWNAVGQRFLPPKREADEEAAAIESLPEVRQILSAISSMSDLVLQEAAVGLTNWLESWAPHLHGDTALPSAIVNLWPSAATASSRTTDATDYKGEEGAEAKRVAHDALNSPIGDLAGAFLLACPNLAEEPHPFESNTGLRAVRVVSLVVV